MWVKSTLIACGPKGGKLWLEFIRNGYCSGLVKVCPSLSADLCQFCRDTGWSWIIIRTHANVIMFSHLCTCTLSAFSVICAFMCFDFAFCSPLDALVLWRLQLNLFTQRDVKAFQCRLLLLLFAVCKSISSYCACYFLCSFPHNYTVGMRFILRKSIIMQWRWFSFLCVQR